MLLIIACSFSLSLSLSLSFSLSPPSSLSPVVGEKEETHDTVNVRTRDNKVHGEHQLEDLIPRLVRLKESRAATDEAEFKPAQS